MKSVTIEYYAIISYYIMPSYHGDKKAEMKDEF